MKQVLDVCCGTRAFWFDKTDARALFVDKRRETHEVDKGTPGTVGRAPLVIDPDVLADFTSLPFDDESFSLVVFDPPHVRRTAAKGNITRKYGFLEAGWEKMLEHGFRECFRVLSPNGTLVFKWGETEIPISKIIPLSPHRPLFGHKTGRTAVWAVFIKPPPDAIDV
jgi:SAM-dependent methyltransferase